jgi:hypothetical protein
LSNPFYTDVVCGFVTDNPMVFVDPYGFLRWGMLFGSAASKVSKLTGVMNSNRSGQAARRRR